MGDLIYTVFKFLTDIPVNLWLPLLVITAPAMVFSATPASPHCWRLGRLLLAVAAGYILINLALGTASNHSWDNYHECQRNSVHREMSREMHAECSPELKFTGGASAVFYLLLGWIPATAYTGFWEWTWRLRHRRTLRRMGKDYKGLWFSNIAIGVATLLFLIYPTCMLIAWLVILILDQG